MAVNRNSDEYKTAKHAGKIAANQGKPEVRGWEQLRSDNKNAGYVEGHREEKLRQARKGNKS